MPGHKESNLSVWSANLDIGYIPAADSGEPACGEDAGLSSSLTSGHKATHDPLAMFRDLNIDRLSTDRSLWVFIRNRSNSTSSKICKERWLLKEALKEWYCPLLSSEFRLDSISVPSELVLLSWLNHKHHQKHHSCDAHFGAGICDDSLGHDTKCTFCRVAFKILSSKPVSHSWSRSPSKRNISISSLASPVLILTFLSKVLWILPLRSYLSPPLQVFVPSPSYRAQSKPLVLSEAFLPAPSHDQFSSLWIFGFKLDSTLNTFSCKCLTFAYIPVKNKPKTFEIKCRFMQGHCISCKYLKWASWNSTT